MWSKALFKEKTKMEIYDRQDWLCIISGNPITDYHHYLFWPLHVNYWPDRNESHQWVGLSNKVHRIIHHPSPKETDLAKEYRQITVQYWLMLQNAI